MENMVISRIYIRANSFHLGAVLEGDDMNATQTENISINQGVILDHLKRAKVLSAKRIADDLDRDEIEVENDLNSLRLEGLVKEEYVAIEGYKWRVIK